MKKTVTVILLAAMLLSLFAMTAFAADPPSDGGIYDLKLAEAYNNANTTVKAQDENRNDVEAAAAEIDGSEVSFYANAVQLYIKIDALTDGNYYLIMAQSDDQMPDKDNIVYIDQITAKEGSAEFRVYPSKLDADVTYHVYLSSNETARDELLSFKYYVAYTLGDVNEDGELGSDDALLVLQAAANLKTLTRNQALAADCNKDGEIGSDDALAILLAAANIKPLG